MFSYKLYKNKKENVVPGKCVVGVSRLSSFLCVNGRLCLLCFRCPRRT